MKMAMNKYTDKAPLPDRFKIGNNMVCDKCHSVFCRNFNIKLLGTKYILYSQ